MLSQRFTRIPDPRFGGMFSKDPARDAAALERMLRGEPVRPAGPAPQRAREKERQTSKDFEKKVQEAARLVKEASPPLEPSDVYARRKMGNELPATRSGDCGDACRATLDGAEPCLETCARLDPVANPAGLYAARNRRQATRRADPVQPLATHPRRPRTLAELAINFWNERRITT